MLESAEPWLQKVVHPRIIIGGFSKALDDAVAVMEQLAVKVDINNQKELYKIVESSIGTKFINRWAEMFINMTIEAVKMITVESGGRKEIDIKNFIRIEKVRLEGN